MSGPWEDFTPTTTTTNAGPWEDFKVSGSGSGGPWEDFKGNAQQLGKTPSLLDRGLSAMGRGIQRVESTAAPLMQPLMDIFREDPGEGQIAPTSKRFAEATETYGPPVTGVVMPGIGPGVVPVNTQMLGLQPPPPAREPTSLLGKVSTDIAGRVLGTGAEMVNPLNVTLAALTAGTGELAPAVLKALGVVFGTEIAAKQLPEQLGTASAEPTPKNITDAALSALMLSGIGKGLAPERARPLGLTPGENVHIEGEPDVGYRKRFQEAQTPLIGGEVEVPRLKVKSMTYEEPPDARFQRPYSPPSKLITREQIESPEVPGLGGPQLAKPTPFKDVSRMLERQSQVGSGIDISGDFDRYQELTGLMKGALARQDFDEFYRLQQETEAIKNRQPIRGMPPVEPSRRAPTKADLKPAVEVNGKLLVGNVGDTHADILQRNGINPELYPHESSARGFTTDGKTLIDRQAAAKIAGEAGTAKAGGLDSQDLTIATKGGQSAIPELRTGSISKTQPPGDIQKVEEEVRGGAGARGEASQEVQRQAQGLDFFSGIPMRLEQDKPKGELEGFWMHFAGNLIPETQDYQVAREVVQDEVKGTSATQQISDSGAKSLEQDMQAKGFTKVIRQGDTYFVDNNASTQQLAGIRNQAKAEGRKVQTMNLYSGLPVQDLNEFAMVASRLLRDPLRLRFNVGKSGEIDGGQLVNRLMNTIPPEEAKVLQGAGIKEAFPAGKKTTVGEVDKWVRENGPRVEVRTVGKEIGPVSSEVKRLTDEQARIRHEMDTKYPNWQTTGRQNFTPELSRLQGELNAVSDALEMQPDRGATHWQSIAPKPEGEMPGYVEGFVRLPEGKYRPDENKQHAGILFPGNTHTGNIPNVLGWFRGYMETRPDGGKTFHVIEVQSDWAQKVRDTADVPAIRQGLHGYQAVPDHPLLKDWERLTLKAAIDHARKEGADRIAVSDAETAMMTEGHDRGRVGHEVEDQAGGLVRTGREVAPIPQAKGMRLHYDQILPRTLAELTGEKGKKVEFGEHKMAVSNEKIQLGMISAGGGRYRSDLIFKGSSGQPKTSVSATEFPLSQVSKARETAPYTIFGKDKPTRLFSGIPIDSGIVDSIKTLFKSAMLGRFNEERAAQLLDAADNKARITARQQINAIKSQNPSFGTKALQGLEKSLVAKYIKANRQEWVKQLEQLKTPEGQTLTTPLVKGKAPEGYVTREITPNGARIAVNKSYTEVFDSLTGESAIRKRWLGRALLASEAGLKHGLLMFDSYHAFRMMRKELFLTGKISYNKGLSLLEYDKGTIQRLAKAGEIDDQTAKWVEDHRADGELLLRNGINVGKLSEQLDSLLQREFKVAGVDVNVIGRFNKWVFGKLSRGAMMEAGLYELERARANHPEWTDEQSASYAAKQINVYMGNLQRQGIFKSQTSRDILQLVFLAPQWVESMAQSEARAYKQIAQVPVDAITKRRIMLGTSGKGLATGVLAYIVANQVVNMHTRGKPTWENPEPDRKLDAFIPDVRGKSEGFWLSPLSDVAEVSHDFVRYGRKGEGVLGSAAHIAQNKLSPLLRAEEALRTGRDYSGKRLDEKGRVTTAAKALIPTPLPLAGATSEIPGQGQRQAYSSLGLKVEPVSRQDTVASKNLQERIAQIAKDRIEHPQTYEGKERAMEESGYQEEERAKRVVGALAKADRQWIESRGLLVPGIASTLRLGKDSVPLSKQELEKLEEYSREEVGNLVTMLRARASEFDALPYQQRQEVFNKDASAVLRRARLRVLEEIPKGNAQELGKTKRRRYSIFGQ